MKKLNELSVFFPLYNEEKNVEELIISSSKIIPNLAEKYEIILIDDGSTDGTKKLAEKSANSYPQVKVISQENKGYGGALKRGFLESKYQWIFYSDGDLQFDLKELENFIKYTNDYDLIIGYRKKRAEGFKRTVITKLLKIWNKIFFNFPLSIKDIDCAFKLIKKESLKKLEPIMTDGGLVSTEILIKAIKNNLKIKQLPVQHFLRKHGKSSGDSYKVIKKAVVETKELLDLMPERKEFILISSFWLILFLLLVPVSLSINYMQNDDYTYYRMVGNFLKGNFSLDQYTGATFYTQGFLAFLYSIIFGVNKLPVLTLVVSLGGIYFLNLIIWKFFQIDWRKSLTISFVFFLNPLFLYSVWGFMTENYFLFFFLVSLYFIFQFFKNPYKKNFIFANIFIWLSYGVRQFGIFTSVAFLISLISKKNKKYFLIQLMLTLSLLVFHFYIFPKTPQMYDDRLLFSNLLNVDRIYTIVYILGIYMAIFLLPFVFAVFRKANFKKWQWLALILIVPILFFFVGKKFEPEIVRFTIRTREGHIYQENISTKFPYLGNVFTRKGFYEDNLPGDKYNFPGYFDIFNDLELAGKIFSLALLVFAILKIRKLNRFALWYSLIFVGALIISPRIFDRYLLPLIFTSFLTLLPLMKLDNIATLFLGLWVMLWLFLGYQFTADSILVNRYIWSEAELIHENTGLAKNKINADNSWSQLYPAASKDRIYHFTYFNFGKAQRSDNYELIWQRKIDYPLNFYRDSYIYLWKNWGAVE